MELKPIEWEIRQGAEVLGWVVREHQGGFRLQWADNERKVESPEDGLAWVSEHYAEVQADWAVWE